MYSKIPIKKLEIKELCINPVDISHIPLHENHANIEILLLMQGNWVVHSEEIQHSGAGSFKSELNILPVTPSQEESILVKF